jgi:predicted amidohydrolase YtcJ
MRADVLLVNADVVTFDGTAPRSVAVHNGRIVALEDVPARQVVDLDGATLAPGFHDAHNHMAWFGASLAEVDLRTDSTDELLDRVGRRAAETAGGDDWVVGSGYDQNRLGGRHPTRDDLERVAPGRRVLLKHVSGHMTVVSSAVLATLGLADRPREVDGGRVTTDAAGRPTGLLEERAQELLARLVLPYAVSDLVAAIDRAGRRYVAEGITSVVEAGIGGGWIGRSPVELAAYQQARDEGRLHVRVELMVATDSLHPLEAHADDGLTLGLDLGIRTGFGDDDLRIGPVKIFSDGSLIGHTAAMCDDFADVPGERGYLQGDAAALTARIVEAHRSGWRVATHAIGDAAIDLVLDAYETAQRRYPRHDPRHRIEHFAVARPDQVARAAALGVVPVPQGRFAHEIGDAMMRAVGPDREGWLYRHRSLLEAGLVLPGSSDRPVADGSPLLGIESMVTRRTSAGRVLGTGEGVDGLAALRAYTLGSAYASRQEHLKGSIEVGKLADLVVLTDSPAAVEPDRIHEIGVLRTMIGGTFR